MSRTKENYRQAEHDKSGHLLKINCHNCIQKLDVSSLAPFEHVNCPNCGADIIVPMWFDHYLFEEHIGEGKFANVYRALDFTLDREAAVKVLKPEYEDKYGELFLNAARKAAKLNHFNITPIYSCGKFDGKSYFVCKYISEGTLADVLHDEGPQPLEKAIPWMIDVTEGLHYASKEGMFHHAVTLEHMPLVEGQAKISDFSSSFFEGDSVELSLNSENEDNLDIFNLGVAFYELLTGSSPGEHNSANHNIPDRIQSLILKMLTEGVENRISYSEIIRVLKGGEVKDGNTHAAATADVQHDKRRKAKNFYLRIAVILLLILSAGAVFFFYNEQQKQAAALNYLQADHIAGIIQAFNDNNLIKAVNLAEEALAATDTSLAAKKEAAVMLVLGYGLNNDPKLSEKCAYAAKMLKMSGGAKDDAIYSLLEYPASLKMASGELLETMSYSNNGLALAHFLVVMRYLYYGCSQEKLIGALKKLDLAMDECNRMSWIYRILNERAVLYRALIVKDEIIPDAEPDPVFKAFLVKIEKAEKRRQ